MIPGARAALLLLLGTAACSRHPEEPASAPAGSGSAVFSREAFAPPPGDAGSNDPPVPTLADRAALDEILAAAPPKPTPAQRPSGADAGADRAALLGTDTGVRGDAGTTTEAPPSGEPPRRARIQVGKVVVEPGMSSPSIERAARAQLYWPLVQRCRDPEGAILPKEVVHLTFQIDRDGYLLPATILAVPREPRFADAARCMARELATATFRAPAAARGLQQNVGMDVPSVD